MPLEFQNLEIPYGQLDTHTDPTAMEPGTLTTAENVSSDVDGRYSKRFGYTALSTAVLAGSYPTDSVRVARRGKELLLFDKTNQYKYVSELNSWAPWSLSIPRATPTEQHVALEQSKNYYISTRASVTGMTLHAYIDNGTGDLIVRVFSEADGAVLTGYTDSTSDYEIVHAVQLSATLAVIFYSSATDQVIRYRTFDSSSMSFGTLTTYLTAADVFAGTVAYPYAPFDVIKFSSTEVTLVWATDTPSIKVVRRNLATDTDSYVAVTLSTEEPDGGFAVGAASATVGLIAFHSATTPGVRMRGFDPTTGAALWALATLDADGVGVGANWNIGIVGNSSTSHIVALDRREVAPSIGYNVLYTVSSVGVAGAGIIRYNQWIAGKPYSYNSRQYLPILAPLRTQDTYFVSDITDVFYDGEVAMFAYRTAHSGGAGMACLPDADNPATGKYAFDAPIAYKFLSNTSTTGAATTFVLDFEDPLRFQTVEMGGSAWFTGGFNFKWDGLNLTENNFLLYPEIRSATAGAVGAGGMNNGTYSYLVVYEVTDQNGNVDRSTTSLPMSATTSAGAGLGKVDLVIGSLNTSYHIISGQSVVASVFRTEAGGETYYHITSLSVHAGLESVAYTDQANDSTILSNRIIYTQGGVLDREPALPSRQFVNHNNRLWGFNGKTVFYSGDYVPGENPWFSTLQRFVIDADGDITALASLDEKLIIFKRDRIFKVTGRGGNAQGSGSDLTAPDVITADCGCIDLRSIVVIPQGVMFQSAKGIYMLSRGEELTFIGMPVSRYIETYPTVTAATMMTDTREVRFQVTDDENGAILVYNYRDNRWTTHTNRDNSDSGILTAARTSAVIVDGIYHVVDQNASVTKETPGEFLDPGDGYIVSELETGWIKPAGKQGLARTQRITFLNEFMDEHDMEFEIDKDYVDTSVQSANYTAADIAALPQEQVSLHIQNQQGEAWRVRMRDSAGAGATTYDGYRAKGVTLTVGVKRGSVEKIMQAGAKA